MDRLQRQVTEFTKKNSELQEEASRPWGLAARRVRCVEGVGKFKGDETKVDPSYAQVLGQLEILGI